MKKAIIIDDSRALVDTMVQMLELLDVEGTPCYGPREAMMILKDAHPDIIFLDVNMPGVDGIEVMSYLRRIPHLEGVPVVFITSDDQKETAGRIRRTGALLIIIKPPTLDTLEMALKKAGLVEL